MIGMFPRIWIDFWGQKLGMPKIVIEIFGQNRRKIANSNSEGQLLL